MKQTKKNLFKGKIRNEKFVLWNKKAELCEIVVIN